MSRQVSRRGFPVVSILALLLTLPVCVDAAGGRTWTTRDGKTYEGLLSGVVNGVAEIDSNGRIIKVPVGDLIDSDQQFIRNESAEGGSRDSAEFGASETPPKQEASAGLSLESRTWTDAQGRKIVGRFGGLKDKQLTIYQNETPIIVPLGQLSAVDQIYVQRILDALDPTRHGRFWTLSSGSQYRGSFVQVQGTDIWILTSVSDDRTPLATNQLSDADHAFVCDSLTRRSKPPRLKESAYRNWRNVQEGWSMIGRLKDFKDGIAVVEQEHQDYYLKLPSMAFDDQAYVREFFPNRTPNGTSDGVDRQSFDESWSFGGMNMGAIAMSVFAVAVLTLICAISLKYVGESFHSND